MRNQLYPHEQRRIDVQALNDTERTQTEVVAENREEAVEESSGPANLGHDEDDNLENDEEPVEYGPECASGLVGHGAASVQAYMLVRLSRRGMVAPWTYST